MLVKFIEQKSRKVMRSLESTYEKIHKGTEMYLGVIHEFYDAFASKTLSLEKRIEILSSVAFFYRIWNCWLDEEYQKPSAAFCRDNNGISHQASIDLELCVGAFCTVVGVIADNPQFQHVTGKHWFDPERMASVLRLVSMTICDDRDFYFVWNSFRELILWSDFGHDWDPGL
jgi:hypothetical protein